MYHLFFLTNYGFNQTSTTEIYTLSLHDALPILRELVEAGYDRKSWLLFASGIEHAEHIAEMLGQFGIDCAAVHSKKSADRKSTRLNSSHVKISYAVFCLKKKIQTLYRVDLNYIF